MTTETMLCAVWSQPGQALSIEEVPVPTPKAGEALVKVSACGVCHTDLHVMKGEVAFPAPAVLGHEISGELVAFGPGTASDGMGIGQQVVGAFIMPCDSCQECLRGRDDLCTNFFGQNRLRGTLYDGTSRLTRRDGSSLAMYSMAGLAQYAVVPVTALAALPDNVPAIPAAVLGCAAFTAYGAVHNAAALRGDETVAVVAVGGVGASIIQIARAAGAGMVIAVDVSKDKLAGAIELGADHSVNSVEQDAVAAVRALTDGRGVDVAFEALGRPETFQQAVLMLADGGRMVAVGIAAGAATAEVPITQLVRRGQTVVGSFGGRTRVDLPKVVELAQAGGFSVADTVTRRYGLEQVNEAFQALERGEIQGRAVITMGA